MKVGSRVVCINDNFHPESKKIILNLPKLNCKYTVRDIIRRFGKDDGLLLHEIHNPRLPVIIGGEEFTFEPNFNIRKFVEVEDFEISESIYESDLMFA